MLLNRSSVGSEQDTVQWSEGSSIYSDGLMVLQFPAAAMLIR